MAMFRKLNFVILFISFTTAFAQNRGSRMGGNGSGGGDPLAIQFMQFGRNMQHYLEKINSFLVPGFGEELDKIAESLDGAYPLLTFPEGLTVDCNGSPKIGCVIDKKVKIARQGYEELSRQRRYEVIALEILRLMNVSNRYALAARLASRTLTDLSKNICNFPDLCGSLNIIANGMDCQSNCEAQLDIYLRHFYFVVERTTTLAAERANVTYLVSSLAQLAAFTICDRPLRTDGSSAEHRRLLHKHQVAANYLMPTLVLLQRARLESSSIISCSVSTQPIR